MHWQPSAQAFNFLLQLHWDSETFSGTIWLTIWSKLSCYIFVMGKDFIIAPWHARSHLSFSRFMLWIFYNTSNVVLTWPANLAVHMTKVCTDSLFQERGKESWLGFCPHRLHNSVALLSCFSEGNSLLLVELAITYTMYIHRYQDIL